MSTAIRIIIDGVELSAELNDSTTAAALLERLPLELRMSRWGDEYYGDIGDSLRVAVAAEARDVLEVGELAFWSPGNALCAFFGPTPASENGEPRAASDVNPLGRITGDATVLRPLGGGVRMRVERVPSS